MSASTEDRDALRQYSTLTLVDLVRYSPTPTELEIVLAEEIQYLLDTAEFVDPNAL